MQSGNADQLINQQAATASGAIVLLTRQRLQYTETADLLNAAATDYPAGLFGNEHYEIA